MLRIIMPITLLLFSIAGSVAANPVTAKLEGERSVVTVGERKPYFALIEFQVIEVEETGQKPRPPINLSLVLDRSGSMSDKGKMEYMLKAAKLVVDRLQASDRLGIIEYDDEINVLWPSSPVEAKAMIKKQIETLTPRGSTNLHGGLMRGVEQVKQKIDQQAINRVLLLSDGIANNGVTSPPQIYRDVRKSKNSGIAITTLGLGIDYNEDLMQGIAENGRGRYYFVENPQQITRIFQEELSSLSQTVAKKVKLIFHHSTAVKSIEVYGYQATIGDNRTEMELEDFYAGEKRSILLRLEIAPETEGQLSLGKLDFSYTSLVANGGSVTLNQNLAVTASKSSEASEVSVNQTTLTEAILIDADSKHDTYLRQFEKGEKDSARQNIDKLKLKLTAKNQHLKSDKLSKKLEALTMEQEQMEQLAKAPAAEAKSYIKAQKQRFYQAKKGKRGLYLLQPGSSGLQVERLQQALKKRGYYTGPIDGQFDLDLKGAVMVFQKQQKLEIDGIAGPRTLQILGLY